MRTTDGVRYLLIELDDRLQEYQRSNMDAEQMVMMAGLADRVREQSDSLSIVVNLLGRSITDFVLVKHDSRGYRYVPMPDANLSNLDQRLRDA